MHIILYPFIFLMEFIYNLIYSITCNYGLSLIFLSIVTSLIMYLVRYLFEKFTAREEKIQHILQPQIDKINRESNGIKKHQRIMSLYQRYSYHPILALRSAVPIFIQLPFLFAAYFVLNNYQAFEGTRFLFIRDLSQPDLLLTRTGTISFSISILPIIMTVINICSTLLLPTFNKKARKQAIYIALFLLVVLYKSSSALLLYWTTNNILFTLNAFNKRMKSCKNNKQQHVRACNIKNILKLLNNYIIKKKILESFRLYLALLVFYIFVFNLATGFSVIMMKGNLYIFIFLSAMLFVVTLTIRGRILSKGKILYFIILFVFSLLIGMFLKNHFNFFYGTQLSRRYFFFLSYILIIISVIPLVKNKRQKIKNIKQKSIMFTLFPYVITPSVFLALNNSDYLFGVYNIIYFLIIIFFALMVYFLIKLIAQGVFSEFRITIISSVYIFLVIILPIIRAFFAKSNTNYLDFILIFTAIYIFAFRLKTIKHLRFFNVVGYSLLITVIISNFIDASLVSTNKTGTTDKVKNISVTFVDTCNVYMLIYDGSPNEKVYDVLGLDNSTLKNLFSRYGFKWYQDTYTLGQGSLGSMGGVFNISQPRGMIARQLRSIYAGNSIVDKIFYDNNYHIYKILNNYLTGPIEESSLKYVDELYPRRESKENSEFDFFVTFLRGIFQGELKFDTQGKAKKYSDKDIQEKKRELSLLDKRKFVVNHIHYPGHASLTAKLTKKDSLEWIAKLEKSYKLMEEDFENIIRNDPESIIIAMGDHGPMLLSSSLSKKYLISNHYKTNFIWDRIGGMIAIRWPDKDKANKYDNDLVLLQDIFPVIFSYLSNDEKYLELRPERTFQGFGYKFKEGKLID